MRRDGLGHLQDAALSGLGTGIGSLPSKSADDAIDIIRKSCPGLPFWPQLPAVGAGELGLAQGLAGLDEELAPGDGPFLHEIRDRRRFILAAAAPPAWTVEQASGLVAFEAAIADGRLRGARALKGQLFGPITLAASLRWQGRPIWEDAGLLRALGVRAAWQVADQAARLRRGRVPVILALDEPGLGLLPPGVLAPDGGAFEALSWALAAIRAAGAIPALHCCSSPPWGLLSRLPVDLVSFDASGDLRPTFEDPDARTVIATRWVAWGMVPTDRPFDALDPAAEVSRWLSSIPAGMDPAVIVRRALVTPACGLAGFSEAEAELALRLSSAIGRELRARTLVAHGPTNGIR